MRPWRAAAFIAAIGFALSGTVPTSTSRAAGLDYPQKTVRLIVPFAAGASTDLVARLLGQKLQESWGQTLIVENRGGAGGGIGAEMVAKAEPDGYTLLVTNPGPSVLNALLRKNSPYALADFAPVIEIGYTPLIVVAHPAFPANDMRELVAYAKANPGKVTFGSSGTNSNPHVALETLKFVTRTDIVHVPYKGTGPALNDVVAGNISGNYTTTVSAEGLITAGQVKVLGIAGPKRMDALRRIQTLAEQGIGGADNMLWIGLVAPAKTPQAIMDKINRDVNAALTAADVRARFAQWGLEPAGGTPKDFEALITDDARRVNELITGRALQTQ
jgi:tripartite-type tricarboxylate transporter receptor subunit TctC